MRLATRVLAAGAILLGLTVGAQADVLGYDNLSQTPSTDPSSGSYNAFATYSGSQMAASFTASASLDLTDVSLLLSNGGASGATPGSMLVVSLFSNNSLNDTPLSKIVQIRSVYDNLITAADTSPGVYDFQLTTPQALTNGQRYWIVASDVGGTALWSDNGGTGGTGVASEFNYEDSTQYANSAGFSLQMCVSNSGSNSSACSVSPTTTFTADSSPTPEPASVAILGAAVIGLAAVRRRRKI